ncbi:S-methyl-5-thioribose-1-phosphate isomerase [Coemansia sp. RSA 2399]|nr:S-methyl-5-thioribose-1-phosphate isomerase [Coemansia sp. RSA 2399]KAJ1908408.1 S-methyl-5-thioribose-1-phosphate isomerase [Coemansia sp. IMI 209127]
MCAATIANSKLQAIRWDRPRLSILNQLLLPHASEYVEIKDSAAGHYAIATMQTRGAPAIAIVAALSLAAEVAVARHGECDEGTAADFINSRLDYLGTSRPTAVNLFDAIRKLKQTVAKAAASGENVAEAYVAAAEAMLAADVADNQRIGLNGAQYIEAQSEAHDHRGIKVLTHCNTGALATAGHGTALGIVLSLYQKEDEAQRRLDHVYFTETRPYNQGARLTSYELLAEEIPATLVCDSAVSALLAGDSSIVAIVVGADRVAANGDTANKIGTYQLAITAQYHGRLFIVAAPTTSVDLELASGKEIVIEERSELEITTATGFTKASIEGTAAAAAAAAVLEKEILQVAPLHTRAWNPSFDVTPASLISAIVTENGVFTKCDGASEYDLKKAFANKHND